MFSFTEQFTLASKALLETHIASATALAQAAFDGGVTLVDLNVDALRTGLAAATVAARQVMSVKTPQEWVSATTSQSQLALQRVGEYGRQASDIARDAQSKFSGVAQTEIAASKQKVSELVEVVKKAPAAVVTPINSFLKTAFDSAHAGYDQTTRA